MAPQDNGPSTTLVPFNDLPDCVFSCGVLHDANGACVPPAAEQVDTDCFCNFGPLQPWRQGIRGVCDYAQCQDAEFSSVQGWFTSFCNAAEGGETATSTATTNTDPGAGASPPPNSDNQTSGGGGDWISHHWRWVIGIVIMVVGIAAIWIGACIWRRRYLKRKERASQSGKHTSATAFPTAGGSSLHASQSGGGSPNSSDRSGPGVFMPGTAVAYSDQSKEKKKWVVRDRGPN
ncbi:hypothetical protein SODALDRAFT_71990 [Sodiomyces alkalinus F11]|uniref:Uncharacterized protein n=1 Tax=Sodiomyces alkalinus (strain CBS 110278 / VKM F-3762 / F11) TaxID=1314773 RepID=A0A3N2PMG9_SODAK|nr:hypothetical protein SODALDRAFT_71990 [Sodiomyces alkalinus F11]ROT35669.1 hypothetical protein SODALDRAFT_71990 [Sodiomyces alkalinus F11]